MGDPAPLSGNNRALAFPIERRNDEVIVIAVHLQQRHSVPVRRNTKAPDVVAAFVQRCSDGILNSEFSARQTSRDAELGAVRAPSCQPDGLDHFSWSAAAEWQSRECACGEPVRVLVISEKNGELAFGGHGEELLDNETDGARLRGIRADRENLRGCRLPGCSINDSFPVRGEPCVEYLSAAKGQLVEGRRRRLAFS